MTSSVLQRLKQDSTIVLILVLFSTLGLVYAVTIPLFETPDEPAHFRYIKWITDRGSLPPLVVSDDHWEQGEFHQPPLYYLVGALVTLPIDTGAIEDLFERNPYAALGVPSSHGNKNAVLHLEEKGSPPSSVGLAVRLLRCLGIIFGTGTVYLTYRIAGEVVPRQEVVAVGAAALTALNPQFIFASAGVNNDGLVTLLSTLVVYLCVRVVRGKGKPVTAAPVLGLAVGLAALTKIGGLALWPLVPVAYGLRARGLATRDGWRQVLRPVGIATAVALLAAWGWYGRNAWLYRDPLGMQSYQLTFRVYAEPLSLGRSLQVLVGSFPSFWGVFGWMNVLAPEWFYVSFRLLTVAAASGLGLWAVRQRKRWQGILRERGPAMLPLVIWTLILLGLVFQWSRSITRTQGRLMFPAISALSLFLAMGLAALVPRRWRRRLFGALIAALFVLAVWVPFSTIVPAYALPQRLTLQEVPSSVNPLDISFGDELLLLGYELPETSVRAGGSLDLRLYWLCRKDMDQDYAFFAHLLRPNDLKLGRADTHAGGGMYPTRLWSAGEVVVEAYRIDVRSDVAHYRPGVLRVGAYRMPGLETVLARDARGGEIGAAPEIARVRVAPAAPPQYEPQYKQQVRFGDKMLLTGYDLSSSAPVAGDVWQITLYWQATTDLARDYTVFLHLVDQATELASQQDSPPRAGRYPTHLWQQGDLVVDAHRMQLPGDLPAGAYHLLLGIYLPQTGQRLEIVGAAPPANHWRLGPFEVR